MRVLVVAGDSEQRGELRSYLSSVGYDTGAAEGGADALNMLARSQYHLVLTDWDLPDMTGLQLISKIRQNEERNHTFIILISERDSEKDMMRGIACGADDYVIRPYKATHLRVRIRAVERIIRLQKKLEKLSIEASPHASIDEPRAIIVAGLDPLIDATETLTVTTVDEVSAHVAGKLRTALRKTDKNFKQFGEEYYIFAPGLKEVAAGGLSERLRLAVAEERVQLADGNVAHPTCSFGVAFAPSGRKEDLQAGVDKARRSLQHARKEGGNTVVVSV